MNAIGDLFAPPPALVAGVDEAGRGPLAGPVAVAAVILDPQRPIDGLDDSKKLTEARDITIYCEALDGSDTFAEITVRITV